MVAQIVTTLQRSSPHCTMVRLVDQHMVAAMSGMVAMAAAIGTEAGGTVTDGGPGIYFDDDYYGDEYDDCYWRRGRRYCRY